MSGFSAYSVYTSPGASWISQKAMASVTARIGTTFSSRRITSRNSDRLMINVGESPGARSRTLLSGESTYLYLMNSRSARPLMP